MPLMKGGYSWDQFNIQEASKSKNMQKNGNVLEQEFENAVSLKGTMNNAQASKIQLERMRILL